MALYIRTSFNVQYIKNAVCTCHEVMAVKVPSRHNNFYIMGIYRNENLGNGLYDCLLTAMASMQSNDAKASFIFLGDFNAHHQEWLNSRSPTNHNGRAALDFANLSGSEQIINEPTHISGNRLDLIFTDVPAVVKASVLAPLGTSDHNSISSKIQILARTPDVLVSRMVYLKSQINWDNVSCDISNIPWKHIYRDNDPASLLNNHLSEIIKRRVPTKLIRSRIKDKAWFNDNCRRAYNDKQAAYKLWRRDGTQLYWENYVRLRAVARNVYATSEAEYKNHLKDILSGASQPHKWWSALKSSLFGIDSDMPPLTAADGSVLFEPIQKANCLSDFFKGKQSNQILDLPPTCFPEPKLTSIAFRAKELKGYLQDLDTYGGNDPDGFFPLFFKKVGDILAPKLAVVFRLLQKSGTFPLCWRKANITPIPKGGTATSLPMEYRPISITAILGKLFERLLSRRLSAYCNNFGLIPRSQFGFRKGLGTCDALLTLVHDIQSSLDINHESRAIALDFSSAFDLVNHEALLYKLKSFGIGGNILNVFKDFLSNRMQRVSVDGCFSEYVDTLSGVPQGSVLGPLFFIIFTSDLECGLENHIISYADDTTLYASIPNPISRTSVAESLDRDLSRISSWCTKWGMKLNPRKTHSIVFSRSRTSLPLHPDLSVDGVNILNVQSFKILGVTLDSKLTFEEHIRSVCASVNRKSGLLRKCYKMFACEATVLHSFYAFILPHLEYCAPVWMSAADSHLRLLDRTLRSIQFVLPNLLIDLSHRRSVGALSVLFKVFKNQQHPLHCRLPPPYHPFRMTRQVLELNTCALTHIRCKTNQFSRCFMPVLVERWSTLPESAVSADSVEIFKRVVNRALL